MSSSQLAIKRLTASDLTFFKWQFEHHYAGNQKAINLNRNIFIDKLFPALPSAAVEKGGVFPIDLWVYGPNGRDGINLQRKITKQGSYKNWRLNGEFIHNPIEDPERFNSLAPDDIALFEFPAATFPTTCRLILVSGTAERDHELYVNVDSILGTSNMAALSIDELKPSLDSASVDADHPIRLLVLDELLEDVVLGGSESADRIWSSISNRFISKEDLSKARRSAEYYGRQGEAIINEHLKERLLASEIQNFEWTSEEINPVSPYDFKITSSDASTYVLDVKATPGIFDRNIHLSMNEVKQIAFGEHRYDIYRVYEMSESRAYLRIAKDLREFGIQIVKSLENLPNDVTPQGFNIKPDSIGFGDPILITVDDSE